MTFTPIKKQLLDAVETNNVLEVEELISNSDSKRELITEHISANGEESLINLLPQFKSKGLVLRIESLLNI